MQEERSPFRGMKLFFIIYFAALILVLTFVGIMGWLGFEMVDATMKYMLFILLMGSAMIAGALWVVKRIWRKWLKIAVGTALTLVVLAAIVGMYLAFSLLLVAATPLHYTTLTSPGGEAVVVMRRVSDNESMFIERAQAAGRDPGLGPQGQDDFGYLYTAHPRKLHFFYDKEITGEGSVEIGSASQAQLMYEWTDDTTLRLFIDSPEPGDGGELIFRVN